MTLAIGDRVLAKTGDFGRFPHSGVGVVKHVQTHLHVMHGEIIWLEVEFDYVGRTQRCWMQSTWLEPAPP